MYAHCALKVQNGLADGAFSDLGCQKLGRCERNRNCNGSDTPFIPVLSDTKSFAKAYSASSAPESILTGCPDLVKHFWRYF